MNLLLREIIFADGSKGRYLIVNHPDGRIGNVKILAKQWNFFKKMGVSIETINTSIQHENFTNTH